MLRSRRRPSVGELRCWSLTARLLAPILLSSGLLGCLDYQDQGDGWANHPDGIVHPVTDSLLSSTTNAPVFSISSSSPTDPASESLVEALATFRSEAAFGQFDGPTDSVLGDLTDAAVLSTGDVAVLDANYSTVRLFDQALHPRRVIGGPGEGPGELEYPAAIFEHPRGWISVVDLGGPHLERFSLSQSPDSTERVSIPIYSLSDGCSIGTRTFVVGTNVEFDLKQRTSTMLSSDRIHELTLAGALSHSFSTPYTFVHDRLVAMTYGEGFLACGSTPKGDRIWVAYSTLGEIHSFDSSGELRWIVKLADFQYPNTIQTPDGIGVDPAQTNLIELISKITLLSESVLGVQVTSVQRTHESGRETSYRTYLIKPETGEFLGAFKGSHQVLGGGNHVAILYRPLPHPQISLVEIG